MILLSHPTGNEFVREALRALNEVALLSEFWTSVSWEQHHFLNHILPRSVSKELGRRSFLHVRPEQLHCYPWIELGRFAARYLNLSSLVRDEEGKFSVDAAYRALDSKVAARLPFTPDIRGVYAYEDGAVATFRRARQLGLKTLYELPIGYWKCYRELMEEEQFLQPEWAMTLQGREDSVEKLYRKDEELALATDIIVPSEFVRGTLRSAGTLDASVTVLPYGAPPLQQTVREEDRTGDGKLKVLFAGSLSQRKGLSYLLQAVKQLGSKIELTLIGRRVASCQTLDAALRNYSWIPSLSHSALLEEMSRHHVMVFPSLFEGCALVVLEAMSQGVPVITTPNAGSSQFVSDGDDGFIVPIRDAEAIEEKLEMLIRDRDRLAAMSRAAIAKAAQHSWEQYRRRFVTTVRSAFREDSPLDPAMLDSPDVQVSTSC